MTWVAVGVAVVGAVASYQGAKKQAAAQEKAAKAASQPTSYDKTSSTTPWGPSEQIRIDLMNRAMGALNGGGGGGGGGGGRRGGGGGGAAAVERQRPAVAVRADTSTRRGTSRRSSAGSTSTGTRTSTSRSRQRPETSSSRSSRTWGVSTCPPRRSVGLAVAAPSSSSVLRRRRTTRTRRATSTPRCGSRTTTTA